MTAPRIYHDDDADLTWLTTRVVTVVGYGNQGRSQALNMRDSGIDRILIADHDPTAADTARADGFDVRPVTEAVTAGDVILLLIPDEAQPDAFHTDIRPGLRPGDTLVVASGYNLAYGLLRPPGDIDVVMVAPRMIGAGVRSNFQNGRGFPCFVSTEHDTTGHALTGALAVARAIGATRGGAIASTAGEEAALDLFTELAIGPAILGLLTAAYDTLHHAGFSDEAILHEMYLSGELAEIFGRAATDGLFAQLNLHSRTSQYAHLRGFAALPTDQLRRHFTDVLDTEILAGAFAREWSHADDDPLDTLRATSRPLPLAGAERRVRHRLTTQGKTR
ncbi:NAD(P)-binding domain-containing protein [Nonomuraea sp. NPDC004297]